MLILLLLHAQNLRPSHSTGVHLYAAIVYTYHRHLLWSPYVIGQTIYFHPVVYSSFFFFFPRLISAVGDWMSTVLPHMVWP